MDKQIFNIKLLDNGDINFKTGRTETPRNRVLTLTAKQVELLVNEKYLVTIDTDDYFNHAFWANRLSMDHADIRVGVVAVDTGFTHKSVAAIIKQTEPGQRVGYRDGNRFNLRADNLYIRGEEDER